MPTTLNSGLQLPDKGSVDWYSSMQTNYGLLDNHLEDTVSHVTAEDKANWNSKQGSLSQAQLDAIAQVATNTSDIATLQSDKANVSHTHSSSDITDIDDYATKDYVDNSISGLVDNAPDALNTLNELSAALNDDSNFAGTVTTALAAKANSADLATVATSGSYNDLDDLPTIPTNTSDLTNDSDFVVSSNLATVATSGDYDDLSNKPSIPTNTSDLTNDSNFVDTSNSAVASGITSAKVSDYDTHIADTDIHVTTADKATWNTVTSKANDSDVVHKSGNETVAGNKRFTGLTTTAPDSTLWPINTQTTDDITFLHSSAVHVEQRGSGNLTDLSNGAWNIANLGYGCFFFRNKSSTDIRYKHLALNTVNRIYIVSNGNRQLNNVTPETDNTYSLGDSTRRWSTINGLEPSALGMPDLSNGIDISSYIDVNQTSEYTAPADGYISICGYTNSNTNAILIKDKNYDFAMTSRALTTSLGLTTFLIMLVVKNHVYEITCSLVNTLSYAKFFPCQGNV